MTTKRQLIYFGLLLTLLTCSMRLGAQLNCSGGPIACLVGVGTVNGALSALGVNTSAGAAGTVTIATGGSIIGASSLPIYSTGANAISLQPNGGAGSKIWTAESSIGQFYPGTDNSQPIGDATHRVSLLNVVGIIGSITNDSAAAGNIGQYLTATVASGAAVTLATGSATPITFISLTAGDWDVAGVVDYVPNAATSITILSQGSQALNGCMTVGPALGAQDTFTLWETAANIIGASSPAWEIPVTRISIASTTTVCLIAKATFSVNTLTGYGTIRARRMR